MALIRMDVDQAQTTINKVNQTLDELNNQLSALGSSVNDLLGAWEGQAQTQFSHAWDDWRSRFKTTIDELQPMSQGLSTERQQIIDADSSSSFTD
ncbi:MAG: WXG100 family type VII secretion target [Chloroflexales bacterium]